MINDIKKSFYYNDISIDLFSDVYEPAEDTYLMINSLIFNSKDLILEIGTGCGIIALECAKKAKKIVATDINPHAIDCAKRNYFQNKDKLKGIINFRVGDLFKIIEEKERFDIIIFNPPYLPTKPNEQLNGFINYALDGGQDGLKTTKQFIDNLTPYMKTNGKAYFIFSSLSNQKKLDRILFKNKLGAEIISSQWFDIERINVYCVRAI